MDFPSINCAGPWHRWGYWLGLFVAGLLPFTASAAGSSPYQSEGTRRMAARLADLSRRANPLRHPFLSERRAVIYRDRLAGSLTPEERLDVQLHYAQELLNAGQSEAAAAAFEEYERLGRGLAAPSHQTNRFLARLYLATAWLRLGEQENCLAHHTTESCLVPISAGGVHRLPRGSRQAIRVLEPLAREFPRELSARWLLNLAYMTLGEHPQGVPADLRIDPARLAPEAPFPRFPDVAPAVGLDVNELSGGVAVDDFNGDGWLDVMMTSIGLADPMHLFWNGGDGTFREGAVAAGLGGLVGGLNLVTADYDNDGRTDVLVLRGGWMGREGRLPKSLLRNNGDGTFDDVTEAAGLLTLRPSQTAAWLDYDGDGWLDLMVGNESQGRDVHPCELWHNRRDGTF
ncbi:MAG: FG-GAP repeat domain-containing protein, partial [Verrucomicrobiota bacterium]